MRAVRWLAYAALAVFPAALQADSFIFNATTDPMTGTYIPVGAGHYNGHCTGCDERFVGTFNEGNGIQDLSLNFSQGIAFVDDTVVCHHTNIPGTCSNTANFYLASDGSFVGSIGHLPFTIYDTSNQLVGGVLVLCTEEALCSVELFAHPDGSPVDAATLSGLLGGDIYFNNAQRIVATGGLQDVIDARFVDGSFDSFEIIFPTPEPSSLFLLCTTLLGLGLGVHRSRRHIRR